MNVDDKREKEMQIVSEMITLYCRQQHRTMVGLCAECAGLLAYSKERIAQCPLMETKTFCSSCSVHCYEAKRREKIRSVMKFSGPRMIFFRPLTALKHLYEMRKEKQRKEKNHNE
jgi:hypothetical protein